jgi:hypothetical protein
MLWRTNKKKGSLNWGAKVEQNGGKDDAVFTKWGFHGLHIPYIMQMQKDASWCNLILPQMPPILGKLAISTSQISGPVTNHDQAHMAQWSVIQLMFGF